MGREESMAEEHVTVGMPFKHRSANYSQRAKSSQLPVFEGLRMSFPFLYIFFNPKKSNIL